MYLPGVQEVWSLTAEMVKSSTVLKTVFTASTFTQVAGYFGATWWWCCCYPTPSEGWGHGGTLRRLNSRVTLHRLKMKELVPKKERRRGSDEG